jgi:hypothetical protein
VNFGCIKESSVAKYSKPGEAINYKITITDLTFYIPVQYIPNFMYYYCNLHTALNRLMPIVLEFNERFNLANGLQFEIFETADYVFCPQKKLITSRRIRISGTLIVIVDMVPSLSQATLSAIKTSRYVDSGINPSKNNQPDMTFFSVNGFKSLITEKTAYDAAISLHIKVTWVGCWV